MKRLLPAAALLLILSTSAWAFEIYVDNGHIRHRPSGTGTAPGPGVPAAPVDVALDFSGAPAGFEDAARWALGVWQDVPTATITFNDLGSQTCLPVTQNFCGNNGVSNVIWMPSNWPFGSGVLGLTFMEDLDSSTGTLWEADIYLNGAGFNWSIADYPVPGAYDVKSLVVHELGHVLALNDIYDYHFTQSTMYGYGDPGSIRPRSLDADDEDGLSFLYPVTEADLPAPGITGIKKSTDLTYSNTLIADRGTVLTLVGLKGYGFIYTSQDATTTIEAQIWQGGSPVAAPAAADLSFSSSRYLTLTIDLSTPPATGEYDLIVINPNGKAGMLPGAIQPNIPGNTPPTVNIPNFDIAYLWDVYSRCADAVDPAGDGDGDLPLQYRWTLVAQPDGPPVSLTGADSQCISFPASITGWYAVDVAVSDGITWSVTDGMEIQVKYPPSAGGGGGSSGCSGCSVGADGPLEPVLPAMILLLGWLVLRRRKTMLG